MGLGALVDVPEGLVGPFGLGFGSIQARGTNRMSGLMGDNNSWFGDPDNSDNPSTILGAFSPPALALPALLRGLMLSGLNGAGRFGVNATSFDTLHIENCVIEGFSNNGIDSGATRTGTSGPSTPILFVKDTISRNNGSAGIFTSTPAYLNHVMLEHNTGSGLLVEDAAVNVTESAASGNTGSDITGGGGFALHGVTTTAQMTLDHCSATFNTIGVSAIEANSKATTIIIIRDVVTNNTTGLATTGGGTIAGTNPGTNLIAGNVTDGSTSSSVTLQ